MTDTVMHFGLYGWPLFPRACKGGRTRRTLNLHSSFHAAKPLWARSRAVRPELRQRPLPFNNSPLLYWAARRNKRTGAVIC